VEGQDDKVETRPLSSALVATTPVSTIPIITPAPPFEVVSMPEVSPI
jgi:hypothetical protein